MSFTCGQNSPICAGAQATNTGSTCVHNGYLRTGPGPAPATERYSISGRRAARSIICFHRRHGSGGCLRADIPVMSRWGPGSRACASARRALSPGRPGARYRHYRYICWEGGHVAQNVYLAAEAAGLGACMVGAFFDGILNDLLRVDGWHEAALGVVAVGPR